MNERKTSADDGDAEPASSEDLEGIGASPGFATGPAWVLTAARFGIVRRKIAKSEVEREIERFDLAVKKSTEQLREISERSRSLRGEESPEVSILQAYILMVLDPTLREEVERKIKEELQVAEWALELVTEELCSRLRAGGDPYLTERSHDFEFVRDRLLRALLGEERKSILPPGRPVILVARDFSPAETAQLSKERVLALVTEAGTRTSHTAILARALEIPAVVGVRHLLDRVTSGELLVVDGVRGRVTVAPSEARLEELGPRAERYNATAQELRRLRDEPPATKCGAQVQLQANIELGFEAQIALEHGAQGIGLYRTEFLYIDRPTPPSEEEQYEAYRKVIETMAPLPVTLRTFDVGGDKLVSAIPMLPEMNPALGLRAVRLGLERPELLKTQLRAMIRASSHGPVRIMIPMVTSLIELRTVRALLSEAVLEVDRAGHPHSDHIPLGCMIEVPSAAILADEFARESEFLSIGTNDLVQYTLAVDRTSRELARLASYYDPAVIRLIKGVIQAGNFRKRPVSVCGAMASDPLAAILLVGMGLRQFSMEASALPEVKAALGRVELKEAEGAADTAFEASTARELEQELAERFAPLLSDILDPT